MVDISEDGEVLGVEIIDASQATPLSKEDLEDISEVDWRVRKTDEFLEISLVIFIGDTKNIVSSNFPVNSGVKS